MFLAAWEQWHNIRQSSTTLVFNSNEMLNSKKVKTHRVVGSSASFGNSDSKKSSELSNTVTDKTTPISAPSVDEKVSDVSLRHSPVSRLRATNSVESLRSVGSANSTASSTFYWQDNDASRPSSSSSISNGTSSSPSKEADTQPHCPTPLSSERISDTVKSISPELSTDCSPHDSNEVVTQQASSKCTGRKKREEELECERLSRDLFSHLSGQDHVLRKLLGETLMFNLFFFKVNFIHCIPFLHVKVLVQN